MRSELRRSMPFVVLCALLFLPQCNNTLGKLSLDTPVEPYLALRTEPAAGGSVGNFKQIRLWYAQPVCGASRLANYRLEGATGTLQIASVSEEADGSYLLSLTGIAVRGSLVLKIDNVKDGSDRPVHPAGISWNSLPTGPQLAVATPSQGANITVLGQAELCWDREAIGAGTSTAYALTGPAGSALAINSVTALGGYCYRLVFTGAPVAGLYTLSFNGISDAAGNLTQAEALRWKFDNAAPYVVSTDPAQGSDISTVTKIDIVFSETVIGAGIKENYVFSGPGAGGLYVQAVNALQGVYRLHVKGTAASGTINLQISNVTDLAGNALTGAGVVFVAP